MGVGLIVRHWELGSTEGSQYEVRLPEELPRLTTTHQQSPPLIFRVVGIPNFRGVVVRVNLLIFQPRTIP